MRWQRAQPECRRRAADRTGQTRLNLRPEFDDVISRKKQGKCIDNRQKQYIISCVKLSLANFTVKNRNSSGRDESSHRR